MRYPTNLISCPWTFRACRTWATIFRSFRRGSRLRTQSWIRLAPYFTASRIKSTRRPPHIDVFGKKGLGHSEPA